MGSREKGRGSFCRDADVEKTKGVFRELNWVVGPKKMMI